MPDYRSAMILMIQSELLVLVEELWVMAAAAPTAKVRDVLTRMANRYAARAADARLTG
jgi:CRP-like cAMP-binding protein